MYLLNYTYAVPDAVVSLHSGLSRNGMLRVMATIVIGMAQILPLQWLTFPGLVQEISGG